MVLPVCDIFAFDYILKKEQVNPSNSIMIGDNINTDIIGGKNAGMKTVYLSSEPKKEEFSLSDYIFDDLNDLLNYLTLL